MTECERLVANGTFSPDFFKPEIRCGFEVTEKRKKIWAVEIDLLRQFDFVCKKHDIKYFLLFGSLLGAIRHKGFVPWDDDVDVGMLRPEYDRFMSLAAEFETPYFFQTPITDFGHGYSHIQLRNSYTTAAASQFRYQGFNLGIFIDILAIDEFDDGVEGELVFNRINRMQMDNSTWMRSTNPELCEKDKLRVQEYLSRKRDPISDYHEIEKLSKTFNGQGLKHMCVTSTTTYGFRRDIFSADDFMDVECFDFEGFKFSVPSRWDNVLKVTYGDYRQLPPIEQRGRWHNTIEFDPDTPYTEYLKVRNRSDQ